MKKPLITIHQDELDASGAEIWKIDRKNQVVHPPHRDDHYMFIIQSGGRSLWELDFNQLTLEGPSLCYVAPGQVHRYLDLQACEGWLVFSKNELLSKECREILDTYLHIRQSVRISDTDAVFKAAPLLEELVAQENLLLQKLLLGSLTETIAGLTASRIAQSHQSLNSRSKQPYETVTRFKRLVVEKCREVKQVKAYAALLHITPLHLNEVVKNTTGFPASYWINQEILLEAKRLLYYTTSDVKQIAYELGYEDHAYFSRFFKKNTGMTALAFRAQKPSYVQS